MVETIVQKAESGGEATKAAKQATANSQWRLNRR
jgi:hypothetical protein